MPTTKSRTAEGKFRTSEEVKERATEIYSHWGLSLSDAINVFLVKSIDVGGLPFSMAPSSPSFEKLSARAYKAPLNADGVAVLPSSWADDDE
ncbi:type II toxin-antitoxin system RelB/DinJ family antitoxin [uncultured Parolsenella sp.]|uniref:type II toxin-antitoxin system RelB/DinJ family antitoxin n=1 Tax=uncultured Parolsenella sp. TaxID=2083008 RepID=UPI0027D9604A|nr:type II toxin-antitoxin system RelB/DinJ family antitoxin [uncultured Parolsenella sp.]